MHEKKCHQKSIKMCLKLPTEKKILTKDAYKKIGPESHSLKSHIKKTSKIILNRKDRKKRRWEIFQQE